MDTIAIIIIYGIVAPILGVVGMVWRWIRGEK